MNDARIIENRVGTCGVAEIWIEHMLAGSGQIIIANNTLHDLRNCLQVSDPMTEVRDVQVVNNLILSDAGPDMAYLGADLQVLAGWRIASNYRQHQPPESPDEQRRWLPVANDRIGERLVPLSLDPRNRDFLAPPQTAHLSTNNSLDGLPGYIGAVPPDGVEPWDWDKTWKARSGLNDPSK